MQKCVNCKHKQIIIIIIGRTQEPEDYYWTLPHWYTYVLYEYFYVQSNQAVR